MEQPRPRTRRLPRPVAARADLVLVPRTAPPWRHLDPPAVVPPQGQPQLPLRARHPTPTALVPANYSTVSRGHHRARQDRNHRGPCLLYTSDAADEEDSVDLG